MRTKRIIVSLSLLAFIFSFASQLPAQETEDSNFKGKLKFGYRAVDTSGNGAEYRYRQDLNLNSGAYLRNFNLYYSPDNELKSLFDRLDVNLYNLGDEPFQSFNLNLQKYGKYQFQWDRRKSTYFYNDRYEIDGGHLYDLHMFDFDRVMDTAFFKFWATKNVQLYAEYDGYTKKGESTTSLDINRVEYEFDKPVDESSREAVVGLNVLINRWNFIAEYRRQDYENANSFFLPGFADGGDEARYPSSMFYFNQGQPYEFKNNSYTFKLNARPIHTLTIKGIAQLSDMDMDLTYNEEASGINYLGRPFEYAVMGEGSFQRKLGLYDFDLNWLFADRFAVVGGIRYHDFKQEGQMEVEETIPQDFAYNTLGVDAGFQFLVTSGLSLTAGYRFEERTLENLHTYTYADKTRRNGLFGNLAWQLSRAFSLSLDYQHGSYDNPYTTISPTSFNRLRGTAKLKVNNLYGTASYLHQSNTNDEITAEKWEYSKNQLNLRGGFHGEALQAFVGFAYIDIKQESDRMVSYPPGWAGAAASFPWNIMYEGKSTLWDFGLSWDFTENWKLGGYFNSYTNRGFWEIDRQMLKGYVEFLLPLGFSTEVAYRYVNFKEELGGMNDYKANIFEFSFGYEWK